MAIGYSTCLTFDSFDLRAVSATDIRFAFLVHLPFRLRVGARYRQELLTQNRLFKLWLRNRVSIPPHTSAFQQLPAGCEPSAIWTEAVLAVDNPKVSKEVLAELRKSQPGSIKYPRPAGETVYAMEVLNHFVIGYATASNEMYGGAPLRIFRTSDFMDFVRWEVTILGSRDQALADATARAVDLKPNQEIREVATITGNLHDLPAETLTQIQRAIERHQDFVFYELAFEAKSKMGAGDYAGALLMAVAALEGVHAAYVNEALTSRLPPDSDRSLPDEFLRELGMSLCNRLTLYIFMGPADRPEPELISQVDRSLQLRNEIMHALRNKHRRPPGSLIQ